MYQPFTLLVLIHSMVIILALSGHGHTSQDFHSSKEFTMLRQSQNWMLFWQYKGRPIELKNVGKHFEVIKKSRLDKW